MNVTCPESAHLESLELEGSPRRLRVIRCSAFPDGRLGCAQTCARRLEAKLAARPVLARGTVLVARSCLG